MLTRPLRSLACIALVAVLLLPSIARAGDCPIFVIGDWGIGKIDNRFMLYLGKGRCLITPIPATPKWIVAYGSCAGLLIGGFAARTYSGRHKRAAQRGFEVLEPPKPNSHPR